MKSPFTHVVSRFGLHTTLPKLLRQHIQEAREMTVAKCTPKLGWMKESWLCCCRMGTMESPLKFLWHALPQEHHDAVLAFQCTSVSAIITLIPADGAKIPGLPLMFRPAQLGSTLCIGCQNGLKSPRQAAEGINRNCSLKFACLIVCSSTGCREEMNQMLN